MDLSYIINEYGEDRDQYFGSISPPLYQSSNFCFPTVKVLRESLAQEMDVPFYTRGNNPTTTILRKKLAALAGAEEAMVFGSGSAAIASAMMAQLHAGDHVVCVQKPYSWTHKLLTKLLSRFGVESTFIDGRDPEAWARAAQPNTKVFMLESPNTMTFELQDIAAVADIARSKGIVTILDNSYCTPLNQKPIEMGIDITAHSASKYLSGHSDMVAGVLCMSRTMCEKVWNSEYMTLGGILAPHDAWLMLRGLRTLPIRMERVAATTPRIVEFFEGHPKVKEVMYPFSPSNPQLDLAKRQMAAPAGQFSILLDAPDIAACERFCDSLQRFLMACSWGGHESLIFPICALYDSANYAETELPWNFIRFYVGLETPEVLLDDLAQALDKI